MIVHMACRTASRRLRCFLGPKELRCVRLEEPFWTPSNECCPIDDVRQSAPFAPSFSIPTTRHLPSTHGTWPVASPYAGIHPIGVACTAQRPYRGHAFDLLPQTSRREISSRRSTPRAGARRFQVVIPAHLQQPYVLLRLSDWNLFRH